MSQIQVLTSENYHKCKHDELRLLIISAHSRDLRISVIDAVKTCPENRLEAAAGFIH